MQVISVRRGEQLVIDVSPPSLFIVLLFPGVDRLHVVAWEKGAKEALL